MELSMTLEGARLTCAWEISIFGNLTLLIHLNWRLLGARIIYINKYSSQVPLFNWTRRHRTHIWVPQNMKLVTFVYDAVYTLFSGLTSATVRRVATYNLRNQQYVTIQGQGHCLWSLGHNILEPSWSSGPANAGPVIWPSMFIRLSCFRVHADFSLCLSVLLFNRAPIPHSLLTFLQRDQTQIRRLL